MDLHFIQYGRNDEMEIHEFALKPYLFICRHSVEESLPICICSTARWAQCFEREMIRGGPKNAGGDNTHLSQRRKHSYGGTYIHHIQQIIPTIHTYIHYIYMAYLDLCISCGQQKSPHLNTWSMQQDIDLKVFERNRIEVN